MDIMFALPKKSPPPRLIAAQQQQQRYRQRSRSPSMNANTTATTTHVRKNRRRYSHPCHDVQSAPVNVDVNVPATPSSSSSDVNKSLNTSVTSVSSTVCGKDQTRRAMERMEAEREARRAAFKEQKREKAIEEKRIREAGNTGDVDFIGMVAQWRDEHEGSGLPYSQTKSAFGNGKGKALSKICICVRKRPVSEKEVAKKDHDCISMFHPTACIHIPKHRVDGITKYLDHTSFQFDYTFCEDSSTQDVYTYTTLPLVEEVLLGKGCRATVFAYGQTGSGKTHTMNGIQSRVVNDLFALMPGGGGDGIDEMFQSDDNSSDGSEYQVTVSFFEIYGVRIQDLLNDRNQLKILEDGKGEVVVSGLEEYNADSASELLGLMEEGNELRTTHATEANDTSSRSHAICQIMVRDRLNGKLRGKMSLVDLAGSERGADTKSHNRQRRTESSEINKSLLALKECIRALDSDNSHVPYRSSKLTLVLKDCFTSSLARTTMIATLGPGSSSADHSLNTLRYADRVKEQKVDSKTFNVTNGSSKQGKVAKAPASGQFQGLQRKAASPAKQRAQPVVPQSTSPPVVNSRGRKAYTKPQTTVTTADPRSVSPFRARSAARSPSPASNPRTISRNDSNRSDGQDRRNGNGNGNGSSSRGTSRSRSPVTKPETRTTKQQTQNQTHTKTRAGAGAEVKKAAPNARRVTRSQAASQSKTRPATSTRRTTSSRQSSNLDADDEDSRPEEEKRLRDEYEALSSEWRSQAMRDRSPTPEHIRRRSYAPTVRDKSKSPNQQPPARGRAPAKGNRNAAESLVRSDRNVAGYDQQDGDFEQDSEDEDTAYGGSGNADEYASVDSFFNSNGDNNDQDDDDDDNNGNNDNADIADVLVVADPPSRDDNSLLSEYDEESDILSSTDDHDHDNVPAAEEPAVEIRPDAHALKVQHAARLLLEAEELLLNTHMESIHETADLLNQECSLIKGMRREDGEEAASNTNNNKTAPSRTDQEMIDYAEQLEGLLDRKMVLLTKVQKSIKQFRKEAKHKKNVQQQVKGR
jgi:kinesin family protein 2/24